VLRRWRKKFQALQDDTFRQRADDITDIGRKLLRHLDGDGEYGLKNLPPGSVLVVERLLPSDVVSLSRQHTVAILAESLGYGSHAALLAREKNIPTVAELPGILERLQDGDEVVVDASRGEVIVAPDATQRSEVEERLAAHALSRVRCRDVCHQPARTLDGELVTVEANLGAYEDVELALENGADEVEVTETAEQGWVELLEGNSQSLLGNPDCTPGYYNNEGKPTGRRERLNMSGYPQGPAPYFQYINAWRNAGRFEGLEFTPRGRVEHRQRS